MNKNIEENLGVLIHRNILMGRRVRQISNGIAAIIPAGVKNVLDVGAGTGEMGQSIMALRPELSVSGVDIFVRPKTFISITPYDGEVLPFENESFDVVVIIDVLHHCKNPEALLKECARVSRAWVVIKDHTSNNIVDHQLLKFMDWVGNRAHGVGLLYNFLSSSAWNNTFNVSKLIAVKNYKNLSLYPKPFEYIFGGRLHFLKLLKKNV